MDVALKAGEILLTSGAEIYRVEDTVTRICRSYNVECYSFVLPTGIFISMTRKAQQSVSAIKRIKERRVDLYRIELINGFSRSLQSNPVTYEEAVKILKNIEGTRRYPFGVRLLLAGMEAFAFTLLLKSSIAEGLAALFISMFIYAFKGKVEEIGFFQFFEYFISGIIAGGAALIAVKAVSGLNIYKTIIGSIIILLPGVAITSGIKDALYGDIVSSLARLGEAIFIAVAVGAGVGIMLSVGLPWV